MGGPAGQDQEGGRPYLSTAKAHVIGSRGSRGPAPDGGLRARTAMASGNLVRPIGTTALQGADAFVGQMIKNINAEAAFEAERGGQNCNMALMSHSKKDMMWLSKGECAGQTRKDYTINMLQKNLSNLGFNETQVSEHVTRTPRGMNHVCHYTAHVGWGPEADAQTPQRAASPTLAAGMRQRPSSAPVGGRRSAEQSQPVQWGMPTVPTDLAQLSQQLSEAERALCQVRAGLSNQMGTTAGAQGSSARRPASPAWAHREQGATQGARPSSAPGSARVKPDGSVQPRPPSPAGFLDARVVTPGRIRPSPSTGKYETDHQREISKALNVASHIPLACPNKKVRLPHGQGSKKDPRKPQRSASCPGHSAARAAARRVTDRRRSKQPSVAARLDQNPADNIAEAINSLRQDVAIPREHSVNTFTRILGVPKTKETVVQGGPVQMARMRRSQSQAASRTQGMPPRGTEKALATKSMPSGLLTGQDCWSQSGRKARKQSKGRGSSRSSSKGQTENLHASTATAAGLWPQPSGHVKMEQGLR